MNGPVEPVEPVFVHDVDQAHSIMRAQMLELQAVPLTRAQALAQLQVAEILRTARHVRMTTVRCSRRTTGCAGAHRGGRL